MLLYKCFLLLDLCIYFLLLVTLKDHVTKLLALLNGVSLLEGGDG